MHEDFGYLHEIITNGVIISKKIVKARERNDRVRTFALTISNLATDKRNKLKVDDPFLKSLVSISHDSKPSNKNLNEFVKKIEGCVSQYNKRESRALRESITELFEDYFILAMLANQMRFDVIDYDVFKKIKNSGSLGSSHSALLDSFLSLQKKKMNASIVDGIAKSFSNINDSPFLEMVAYLSHALAQKFPDYKAKLLFEHYRSLKKLVPNYSIVTKRTTDRVLTSYFVLGIILFSCGYSKSLRLSKEETNNYLEETIKIPMLSTQINNFFDEVSSIKKWRVSIKLSYLVLIDIFLLVVSKFYDIHIDIIKLSVWYGVPLPIEASGLQIPLLFGIGIVIAIEILIKVLKTKRELIKRISG